jgi:hypothetical protein
MSDIIIGASIGIIITGILFFIIHMINKFRTRRLKDGYDEKEDASRQGEEIARKGRDWRAERGTHRRGTETISGERSTVERPRDSKLPNDSRDKISWAAS